MSKGDQICHPGLQAASFGHLVLLSCLLLDSET